MDHSSKRIYLVFLLILVASPVLAEFRLADPPPRTPYRSMDETKPVISPVPRNITYGNDTVEFSECDIEYTNDSMLTEIVEIYNDVTYGKDHKMRCRSSRKHSLNINIDFAKLSDKHLPHGFEPDFEKYTLVADSEGNITIAADYYPGVVRGLDTLSQLIIQKTDEDLETFQLRNLPINITDYPEYAYRGLMIDTARDYFFPDVLKMSIDGMMLGRNNAFHWHFSEDDSIPMFSTSYPDLVNYTAFTPREIYTVKDVKEIVRYAKIRGVKVIPEFEGPSHLHILGFYPEFKDLVGCFRNYTSTSGRHGGPPYAPVNPADERTYTLLAKWFDDLKDAFESDYWHLGGDEVSIGCVSSLRATKTFLAEHNIVLNQLQDYYINRERETLRELRPDVRAGYWFRGNRNKYGEGDVLQYWGGGGSVKRAMSTHPTNYFIYSPSGTYYLDCGYVNQYFGGSWCGSLHSWRDIYNIDPRSLHDADKKEFFMGGELPLWSEMNNEFNMPLKLFPRGGAMSFRYWNPDRVLGELDLMEVMVNYQNRLKNYDIPSSRVTNRY